MSKKSIMSKLLTAALAAFTALPMLTVSAYAEEGSSGEGGGLIREVSVELDASGRIGISADLRNAAGLGKDVVLVGDTDHFEIWDAKLWDDFCSSVDLSSLFVED